MDLQTSDLVHVTAVDTASGFRGMADDWNGLVKRSGGQVFLRHEWFDAAWAWRKLDSKLLVLLAWRADTLIGILPLIRLQQKENFLPLRCLEFLTVPDTQICDVIVAPENRQVVINSFCATLHERRDEWDRLNFRYLKKRTTALQEISNRLEALRHQCYTKRHGLNLFVRLDTSWDQYYSKRTRSLKKANNLAANRLKKMGEVEVHWITGANTGEPALQRALEQVIEVSGNSWKRGTGLSLNEAGPKAFIDTLTRHAARNGWLSLWTLSLDGKVLAMEYQLLDAGHVYALRSDFDAGHENHSPGSFLMHAQLQKLFELNLSRYHMGLGNNLYKTRWTRETEMLYQLVSYSDTWAGRAARVLSEVIKPTVRSLVRKFRRFVSPNDTNTRKRRIPYQD